MMSKVKYFLVGAALAAIPFGASPAHVVRAADINLNDQLDDVNDEAGYEERDLTDTLGTLINVFLGLLGIIFLILIIYAGFLWMTAGGNDKNIAKAKSLMLNGVIGLIILLSAYAISNFVIEQLTAATGNG